MKLATAAALDPEARYLDYERVIRELEEAERDYKLDAAGVIEKLKDAVATCQSAADRYTVKAAEARRAGDAYIIARGKYLAEIKRRVELPRGGGRGPKATPERPGWENWCRQNGVDRGHANLCVEAASGDQDRLVRWRGRYTENKRRRRQRAEDAKRLPQIKRLWGYLTPAERAEFIQWALSRQDEANRAPIQQLDRATREDARAMMDAREKELRANA